MKLWTESGSYLEYTIQELWVWIDYIESAVPGDGTRLLERLMKKTKLDLVAQVSEDNMKALDFFTKRGFELYEEDEGIIWMVLRRT